MNIEDTWYYFVTERGQIQKKKEAILFGPPLYVQEILADDDSLEICVLLARHTQYPQIIRKLHQKNIKINVNNHYIPSDVLDDIFEKTKKYWILDLLVTHPNASIKLLKELQKINHPQTVGQIATTRLNMKKFVDMIPNQSELSFLMTSSFVNL